MPTRNAVRPSGVSSSWKFDYTPDYGIDGKRVTDFLRSLFGKDYKFFVKVRFRSVHDCPVYRETDLSHSQHVGEEYLFWVPRKLTEVCRIPGLMQATW